MYDDERRRKLKMPATPTEAEPGTRERVEVYRQRYARGEHLHHPGDLATDGFYKIWKGKAGKDRRVTVIPIIDFGLIHSSYVRDYGTLPSNPDTEPVRRKGYA